MSSETASSGRSAREWFDTGNALRRAGDFAGALGAYRNSIRLGPHNAAPWLGLAQLLEANNQFEDARQCLRQAVVASPGHLLARLQLANTHKSLGYIDDALCEYEAVLAMDSGSAAAHFGLGQLFEDLGEPDRAASAYREALKIDPAMSEALANLLGLGRHVDISAEIETATAQMEGGDARRRALLGYGLGKALDQQHSHDAAVAAYRMANEARRAQAGAFDRPAFDRRIDAMINIFSQAFFDERRGWGDPSDRPVFIVGLPRSGTTLTEQIIASHPQCHGAGELAILTDLATGTPDRRGTEDPPWPRCAPLLTRDQIEGVGRDYIAEVGKRADGATRRVIDKQPLNFWHLGLIAVALPNARIIHCTRDIRDCGFSIFTQNFNVQQSWSTDLGDIAHYWRGYRRLMDHMKRVSGLAILDVAYEDTVADLDARARQLLVFAGLPWDERVLQFHANERAVQTPSRWQVRQPVYQSSKARWRLYERHLAPLIEAAEADG